jgi:hypothetical protein
MKNMRSTEAAHDYESAALTVELQAPHFSVAHVR